jgi:hypothetical protein
VAEKDKILLVVISMGLRARQRIQQLFANSTMKLSFGVTGLK